MRSHEAIPVFPGHRKVSFGSRAAGAAAVSPRRDLELAQRLAAAGRACRGRKAMTCFFFGKTQTPFHIFSQIPYGNTIAAAFFILLLAAAITSGISILEVPTASLIERFHITRVKACTILYIIIEIITSKKMPVKTKSRLNTCEPYSIK